MTTTTSPPPFDPEDAIDTVVSHLVCGFASYVAIRAGVVDVTIVALAFAGSVATNWRVWRNKIRNLSRWPKAATFLTLSRHKENASTGSGSVSNEEAAGRHEDVNLTKAPSTPRAGVQTTPLKTPSHNNHHSNNPNPASWAPPSSNTRHKMKASANEILTTPPPTTRSDGQAVSTRTRSKKRHATSDSAHGM